MIVAHLAQHPVKYKQKDGELGGNRTRDNLIKSQLHFFINQKIFQLYCRIFGTGNCGFAGGSWKRKQAQKGQSR